MRQVLQMDADLPRSLFCVGARECWHPTRHTRPDFGRPRLRASGPGPSAAAGLETANNLAAAIGWCPTRPDLYVRAAGRRRHKCLGVKISSRPRKTFVVLFVVLQSCNTHNFDWGQRPRVARSRHATGQAPSESARNSQNSREIWAILRQNEISYIFWGVPSPGAKTKTTNITLARPYLISRAF